MEQKIDLRVVKTKKALVDAMLDSMRLAPFEEISVQSICQKAMVRRATFYTHFADKYQLFAYAIRQVYGEFPSFQNLNRHQRSRELYVAMIEDGFSFLVENMDLVKSMLGSNLAPLMMNLVSTEIAKDMIPWIQADMATMEREDLSSEVMVHFYIRGVLGAFLWWIHEKQPISKEELLRQVVTLIPPFEFS